MLRKVSKLYSNILVSYKFFSLVFVPVLSFCEILDISAVLYVCYADSLHIDSQSIQPLFNLFHTSPELSSLLKTDKNLKNYHYSSSITQSNMYLWKEVMYKLQLIFIIKRHQILKNLKIFNVSYFIISTGVKPGS